MNPTERMEAEMKLRNFSPKTQAEYLRCVRAFSQRFGKAPEMLGAEEVRRYLLEVRDVRGLSPLDAEGTAGRLGPTICRRW